MRRDSTSWYSPSLNQEMPIATYGDFGFAILLVPTAAADYLEYERFQLIDSLSPHINAGKIKVFSVNSINNNASIEERKVDGLWDSHKNGRKNVVEIAAGASFTNPTIDPSNSIPKEKFELAVPELAWSS